MKKKIWITLAAVLILAIAAAVLPGLSRQLRQESREAIREAVLRSAVQCYAVEGAYPESLAYLEEHYGIQVDEARYTVDYSVFASNLMPDITVLENEP